MRRFIENTFSTVEESKLMEAAWLILLRHETQKNVHVLKQNKKKRIMEKQTFIAIWEALTTRWAESNTLLSISGREDEELLCSKLFRTSFAKKIVDPGR